MSFLSIETRAQTFTLTAVSNPSGGASSYTGVFLNGGSNGLSGYTFTIAGFTNAVNNGTFICLSSTTTTISLYPNVSGVSETHAATATTSPFFGIGPAQPAGQANSVVIPTPNRLMISAGQPIIASPSGDTIAAGISYTSQWQQVGVGSDIPILISKSVNPQVNPATPFVSVYGGVLSSDPSYTGDSSTGFMDVLDMNTFLRSPAHFGQVYGLLIEHGATLANGQAIHIDDLRRIYVESLMGNGAGFSAVYNVGRLVGVNCATGGYLGPQNGIIGQYWAVNIEGPRLGGGNAFFGSVAGIRMASQQQAAVVGSLVVSAVSAISANTTLTLSSVAAVISGVTTYTGTITGGASNAFAGYYFTTAGFTNTANNGTFFCAASSATTLTLVSGNGVTETHAATAIINTADYTGVFPNAGANVYAGQVFNIAGFTNVGASLTLTAASNHTTAGSLPGMTTYTGTITGGDSNNFIGRTITIAGFTNSGNNGTFLCYASTATTLILGNGSGVAETHAGTANLSVNNGISRCIASTATTLTLNNYLATAETHAATAISRNGTAWGITQDDAGERNALGSINIGGQTGPLFSSGGASPEGIVTSSVGGLYLCTGGSAGTALYSKESGASNTGWIPFRNVQQNPQSGTSYAIVNGDRGKRVTLSNTAAVAVSLPQPGSGGGFITGWLTYVENVNTGLVTITPAASTINGLASIQLFSWQWAIIFSDGTNYQAMIQPLSSTDAPDSLSSYLTNDASPSAAHNQLVVRNINTGVDNQRKGLNVYVEHDGAEGSVNYDGLQVNVGFTADANTAKTQGQTDGAEIVCYGTSVSSPTNFVLTSVANASAGSTVYTGTITNGGSNFYAGWQFQIIGFTNAVNNGIFICTASTTTTLTLTSSVGAAETHAATAYWYQIVELNALKLRWGIPVANAGNVLNFNGILQYLPIVQSGTTIGNFVGHGIDAPIGGGNIVNYFGISGGNNFGGVTVQNAVAVAGFFIDGSVTNSYGGIFGGKSGSVLADDGNGVARSFIGHANLQTAAPYALHDGWYGSTGSPETVVTAAIGSMYSQQDGNVGSTFHLKTQGTGNTGWGALSPRVKSVNLTGQLATIGSTLAYAVPTNGAGQYRVSWSAKVTLVDSTSLVLGGTNGFRIGYTDNDDSVVVTTPPWWGAGNNGTAPTSATINSTQNQISGVLVLNVKASTNINYLFDFTSGSGNGTYSLHIRIEAI